MDFFTDKKFDISKTRMCGDFAERKTRVCADHMKTLIKSKDIDYISKGRLKRRIVNGSKRYAYGIHKAD